MEVIAQDQYKLKALLSFLVIIFLKVDAFILLVLQISRSRLTCLGVWLSNGEMTSNYTYHPSQGRRKHPKNGGHDASRALLP